MNLTEQQVHSFTQAINNVAHGLSNISTSIGYSLSDDFQYLGKSIFSGMALIAVAIVVSTLILVYFKYKK